MKAHRLKLGFTTKEDLRQRFYAELFSITDKILTERTKGQGILARMDYWASKEHSEEYDRERAKLIKAWEKNGISTAFLNEPPEGAIITGVYKPFTL